MSYTRAFKDVVRVQRRVCRHRRCMRGTYRQSTQAESSQPQPAKLVGSPARYQARDWNKPGTVRPVLTGTLLCFHPHSLLYYLTSYKVYTALDLRNEHRGDTLSIGSDYRTATTANNDRSLRRLRRVCSLVSLTDLVCCSGSLTKRDCSLALTIYRLTR